MEMGLRKEKILSAIVANYILNGEPIGSKALMQLLDISVSSATIRNEMSELSEMGYIEQPHTSAGRIPSQKGYRYYIDNLMPHSKLTSQQKHNIAEIVPKNSDDTNATLAYVGRSLAQLTGCAVFVTTPGGRADSICKIELVQISKYIVMIILLTNNGTVENQLCRLNNPLSTNAVNVFNDIVLKYFLRKKLDEFSTAYLQTIAASVGEEGFSLIPVLFSLTQLINRTCESALHLDGQVNLLGYSEYSQNFREILDFLNRRDALQEMIFSNDDILKIKIGKENSYQELENSSTILCKYDISDGVGGVIGIIGPTRMDYSHIIPSIEYLSRLLGNLLSNTAYDDFESERS